MEITISYNETIYPDNHVVSKLSNIILNNIKVLKLISNIYILEGDQKEKFSEEPEEYKLFLKGIIKNGIMSGLINEEDAGEFLELWISISSEKLGNVLEQLIAKLGPYNCMSIEKFDKSMDAKVIETKVANDFDVIFFDEKFSAGHKKGNDIKIKDYNEFHECKKNVCTFIPTNPNAKLKKSVKNKLEFIKSTYDLKKSGKYYIPTFFPLVDSQREFLNEYKSGEFSFIEILSVNDLYFRYSG
ncbi:hypothetical protein QYB73_002924 [Clostridium perfringens]|nr:hypothetical protein [Clostridium perfringens]